MKTLGNERGILSLGGQDARPNGALQAGLIRPRAIGLSLAATYEAPRRAPRDAAPITRRTIWTGDGDAR